jgi:hypothetical protein
MTEARPTPRWTRICLALGLGWLQLGCSDTEAPPRDMRFEGADLHTPDQTLDHALPDLVSDANVTTRFLTRLLAPEDLALLQGKADHVKYIGLVHGAPVKAPIVEPCYFQNMTLYPWHIIFLASFPELSGMTTDDYAKLVLNPATRIWWGGGVLRYKAVHPLSGEPECLAYTVYAEGGDTGLTEQDIVQVDGLLKSCMPYATKRLAFFPSDPAQKQLAQQSQASLVQQGVAVLIM